MIVVCTAFSFQCFRFKEACGDEMIQGKVKKMTSYTHLLYSRGLFEYVIN